MTTRQAALELARDTAWMGVALALVGVTQLVVAARLTVRALTSRRPA